MASFLFPLVALGVAVPSLPFDAAVLSEATTNIPFEVDFEAAANAVGANGVALWESYVAGLDPTDAASRFTALISLETDGVAHVTWTPDLSDSESPRTYTVYGKAGLGDADWTPVTDANRARMRFFRVRVELK